MQTLTLPDGEPIDVLVQGQGTPLVLLHGWTSGPHIWMPFIDDLAAEHQVIAWRARGHRPASLQTATAMSLDQLVDDLHFMLEHFQIRHPVIVGHSMGAMLLWHYIRRFGSDHLRGVVFIDQSPCLLKKGDWPFAIYGHFDEAQNQALQAEMRQNFAEAALNLAARGLNPRITAAIEQDYPLIQQLRSYLSTLHAPALIQLWQDMTRQDWRDVPPTISVPVALLYGGKSQFYPVGVVQYLCEQMPQAQAAVFAEADHSPQLSAPDEFRAALLSALRAM